MRLGLRFTRTERRILHLLIDGAAHAEGELRACLGDDLADASCLHNHLSRLRKKVRAAGCGILCETTSGVTYRLAYLAPPPAYLVQ